MRCWPRVSPAVIDLQALRAFKPQLLRVTGISAGLARLIWHCVQPHRGCDVVLLLPQRVSPAVIDIQALRAFKPQLLRVTGISAGLARLIWYCVQPHRGCDVVLLLPPRVSPAVIDIQALRACLCNSEIFVLNLSGSHSGLPLPTFLPKSFQSGISGVACNVSTVATINSQFSTPHS